MTPNDCLIRPLAESDLSEWLRLRQKLWDQSSEAEHREEMVAIFEDADSQFVAVADAGNSELAGFLEASIRSHVEDCDTENVGYLEGWFVDAEYRQQGLGARLVEAAEKWARSHGCTEMASDAEIDNIISQKAHERLGYAETSRLVHLRKELV
ncbi:MAG TPA: aminoglycoside 6'-N-acetyltransferase [Pyrinomonadaceae bacterium]|jgi:aminoglycoside 6'-N-acetyltransferase I|nr:aminoglycoside 6'-N-acetyltransferase [Pyrinomonadaceae bacterium]